MRVPLFDLKRLLNPQKSRFVEAFTQCLETAYFVNGPEVTAFEEEMAEYVGAPHVIGVSSGTDALVASLMASNLQKGDEVLVTSFTFVASATSILLAGMKPVFVDVAPDSFHPTLDQIKKVSTPQTRALIYVHLFGEPNELKDIKRYCDANDIILIEDCAQSFGARFDNGEHIGTQGDTACFSFFPAKNLGCFGDGGAVITADDACAERIRMIKNHGSNIRYHNDILGANFRLDTIQAAVLSILLPGIDEWNNKRKENAEFYLNTLQGLDIKLPPTKKYHTWNQFTLRVPDRDRLKMHLDSCEIGNAIYYPIPNHRQQVFAKTLTREQRESLPNTDRLCGEVLSLPIYPGVTAEERAFVAKTLREYYGG